MARYYNKRVKVRRFNIGDLYWKIWFCISYKTHSESNKHGSISFMIDNMHYIISEFKNKIAYLGAVNFKTKD